MTRSRPLLLACALLVGACGDDDATEPVSGADAGPHDDAGLGSLPGDDAASADAGGTSTPPIPLIDWVDDLVDKHSSDMAIPDTVHDKNIVDDEDPAKFDKYFQLGQ